MAKLLQKGLILLLLVAAGFIAYQQLQQNGLPAAKKEIFQNQASDTISISPTTIKSRSLFVPYWTVNSDSTFESSYNRLIYFGIAGTTEGVNRQEPGYQNLEVFQKATQGRETLLTVRMTNNDTNFAVLTDKTAQKEIIRDSISTAREFGFSGIVFDFEITSFFDDKVPGQINSFVEDFYKEVKANDLHFALTIYGDVFYRQRPYDLPFLGRNSDEIMIMAYDFHKSAGEPGPNFPLGGKEKYGYDFETMIKEYEERVAPEKLTVLFGMYGYDWAVDEQKRPIKRATAITVSQIEKTYLEKCGKTNCVPFRDKDAKEQEINYVDEQAQYHVIWFEDLKSTQEKTEYLERMGIDSVGYWAYSYF